MKIKSVVFIVLLMGSTLALGQEGAEVHEHGIPRMVFFQALNFFGLLILLYFFLRKKVSAFFLKRHDDLTIALREAKKMKEEALSRQQEYLNKLKELDRNSNQIFEKIRQDGEHTKNKIIEEAKRVADTIKVEAQRTAQNEIEKAKIELYDDVLKEALSGARTLLSKSVIDKDQLRLQKEFVEKIEAVQ